MGQKSLAQYLTENAANGVIDHTVRCQMEGGVVTFYIHPQNVDGETLDFKVLDNDRLLPKF